METTESEAEFRLLCSILSDLVQRGLINETTKSNIEQHQSTHKQLDVRAALYLLLVTSENTKAWEIFNVICQADNIIRNREQNADFPLAVLDNSEPNETNPCNNVKANPMLNDVVVNCIFGYLSVQNVKTHRTVCKSWENAARQHIRRLCKTKFNTSLRPADFIKTFKNSESSVPFSAFSFKAHLDPDFSWSVKELSDFFETFGTIVKDLRFIVMNLKKGQNNERVSRFDIQPWIASSNLTSLKIKDYTNECYTKLIVPWNQLVSIQHLELHHCIVNIDHAIRITPISIYISCVHFHRGGTKVSVYCISDLVDFSRAKEIKIWYAEDLGEAGSLPVLNVGRENVNAKSISLTNTRIVNWKESSWKTDSLLLTKVPILEKGGIQFKKLEFGNSAIDLAALSQMESIEQIKLVQFESSQIRCSRPTRLPNLKSLCVDSIENISSILEHFNYCNLVNVCLDIYAGALLGQYETLNLNYLPAWVNNIKIKQWSPIEITNGPRSLEKLILWSFSYNEADKLLTQLRPKILVVYWSSKYETNDSVVKFLKRNNQFFQTIVTGPFLWEDCPFETSCLFKLVDKKSEYYSFENRVGTALTHKEFDALSTF